ncbi:MAG: hypothetical protein J0M24_15885, partial [Verrucomicrobia bacterium]|nr:hypothetical protein [Verrucomicrobiota bacterium]
GHSSPQRLSLARSGMPKAISSAKLGFPNAEGSGASPPTAVSRMNRPGVPVGIRLYTPVDVEGTRWQMSTIDDNTMACEDLVLADLNGDGKLDIVASGRATKNLKVWFNER